MLMTEQQVRLNEVRLRIKETLDYINFLKENHAGHPLSAALDTHIAYYRARLDALKEELRQLGALPREPDPEHEIVEQMLAEVKSLFGSDPDLALVQEFNRHRNDIVDTVQYALEVDYPADVRATLVGISDYSRAIQV